MSSKLSKKCLSILLTVCLVVALITASAFAGEEYESYEKTADTVDLAVTETGSISGELTIDAAEHYLGGTVFARIILHPENEAAGKKQLTSIDVNIKYDSSYLKLENVTEASGWTLEKAENENQIMLRWGGTEKDIPMLGKEQMVAALQFTAIKEGAFEISLGETQALTVDGRKISINTSKTSKFEVIRKELKDVKWVIFQVNPSCGKLHGEIRAYMCREYPGIYKDEECTEPFELPEFEPLPECQVSHPLEWMNVLTGEKYTAEELMNVKFSEEGMILELCNVTYTKEAVDAEGNKTTYVFDINDNLIRLIDALGNESSGEYDRDGNLISETTAIGYKTTYKYDEQGRLIKKTYADGTYDRYTYDKEGRLASHTRPWGNGEEEKEVTEEYKYEYANKSEMVYDGKTERPVGEPKKTLTMYTTTRDSDNQELLKTKKYYEEWESVLGAETNSTETLTDAEGRNVVKETSTWVDGNSTTVVKDAKGGETKTRYISNWNQVHDSYNYKVVKDPLGYEIIFAFDKKTDMISYVDYPVQNDRQGSVKNRITFDYEFYGDEHNGKIKKLVKTDGAGNKFTSTYDVEGRVLTETDSRGNTTRYEYDKLGRCTAVTSPSGMRTEYEYDPLGRMIKVIDGKSGDVLMYYKYDADGRLVYQEDAEGVSLSYEYDCKNRHTVTRNANGAVIEEFVYDKAGNVASYTDGNGNVTSYTYDALGRLLTQTALGDDPKKVPEKSTQSNEYNRNGERTKYIDESGREVSFEYDNNGNVIKIKDKAKTETTFTYDANNRQTSTVVHAGDTEIVTSMEYDGMGNLVSVTMPNGGTVKAEYNHNNQVISSTDAMGNTERRSYDENGNLTSITDFRGNTTSYLYDEENRHIATIDALGNGTSYKYDERGRLNETISVIDGKTISRKIVYDKAGRVTEVLNELAGSEVRYEYDNQGRVSREIYEDGKSYTSYTYDDNGNVVKEIYYSDGKEYVYEYKYDKNGQITSITDPKGNKTTYEYTPTGVVESVVDALGVKTSYTYDDSDNVKTITDAKGNTVSYEYDSQQRVIKVIDANGYPYSFEYDNSGNLTKVINPDGGEEVYEYDLNNRLISVRDSENNTTRYSYDANGNVISVTDARGNTSRAEYDALNRKTATVNAEGGRTEYTYDALGRVTQVKDADGALTKYKYDAKGRVVSIEDAYGNIRSYKYDVMDRVINETDENGNVSEYEYYGLGNVVKYTNELGAVTTYTYDLNGNCVKACDPMGREYSYTYDKLNRLVSQKDPEDNTVSCEYDVLGNLVKVTDERGSITQYAYDPNGNVVSAKDALGTVTEITYDSMNRPVSRFVCNKDDLHGIKEQNQEVSYTYDHRGLVTTESYKFGPEKSFKYDKNGNLIQSIDADGQSTYFEYTALNLLKSARYSDGATVEYIYDKTGALVEMHDMTGATCIGVDLLDRVTEVMQNGKTTRYEYDAAGNMTSLIYPDGNKVDYEYDEAGNLITIYDEATKGRTDLGYNKAGDVTIMSYANGERAEYEYDKAGRMVEMREYMTSDASFALRYKTSYGYDKAGNRTKIVREAFEDGKTAETETQDYSYDKLNRMVSYNDGKDKTTYYYDAVGNMVLEKGSGWKTDYQYDRMNRLVFSFEDGARVDYTYDGRGNRTSERRKEGTYRYEYDGEGRLKKASTPSGNTTVYKYNGLGMRVESITVTDGRYKEPVTRSYFPDFTSLENDDLYVETKGRESFATRYIYAGSERLSQITKDKATGKEKTLYVHENIQGSTSFFTEKDGSLYGKVTFDPWGKPEISKELLKDETVEITFTGHPYDKAQGLYFAEARFYDPKTRVFMSEDPARDGLNWYQYCAGNPVNYWDPTGLSWLDDMHKGIGDAYEEAKAVCHSKSAIAKYLQERVGFWVWEWEKYPEYATIRTAVGAGTFAITALSAAFGGEGGLIVSGAMCGAIESGLNVYLDEKESGRPLDIEEIENAAAKGAISGAISFGIMAGAGRIAGKFLGALELCGKSAADTIEQFAFRWAISTVGMAAGSISGEIAADMGVDHKSFQESWQETRNHMGEILFNSVAMSLAFTIGEMATAPKCFTAGTLVLTEEGLAAIETVKAGDMVLAFDEETGEVAYKEVVQTFENTTDELTYVTVETEEGEEETIESTPGHPYYVEAEGEFIKAYLLEEGTELTLADGTKAVVKEVVTEELTEPVKVYNFEVSDFHTYYVGESGVLVHNSGCGGSAGNVKHEGYVKPEEVRQLEAYAREHFVRDGGIVDFGKLDKKNAQKVVDAFEYVFYENSKMPRLGGIIVEDLKYYSGLYRKKTQTIFLDRKNVLESDLFLETEEINPEVVEFRDNEETKGKDFDLPAYRTKVKTNPLSGIRTRNYCLAEIVSHEMGHHLHHYIWGKCGYEFMSYSILEHAGEYAPKISCYAQVNFNEYIAESFVMHTIHGGAEMDPILGIVFREFGGPPGEPTFGCM